MKKRVSYLLQKYTSGQLSKAEEEELLNLTDTDPQLVANEIAEMLIQVEEPLKAAAFSNAEQVLAKILAVDKPIETKKRKLTPFLRWTAAAALVLIGIASLLYLVNRKQSTLTAYATDISAGGNKAFLRLADGRKVSLTDARNGDIAKQAGVNVVKTAQGQLVYSTANKQGKTISELNTIETPRGGMWQVKLPDGTSVWLNAATLLTYPVSFAAKAPRIVTLKGEAYFEVAKDKTRPFIVRTEGQEVGVLGTHFNINSYANEGVTKTTLLEGSVKIKANNDMTAQVLKPGEQAVLSNGNLSVAMADTEEAIAWKNGEFMFNHEKLSSIMRKISRWYDVEIEYADAEAANLMYYGTMNRFDKVSKILRKFEQTGEMKFKISEHKITVYKVK